MTKPEILDVVDTREYVEVGEKWVPVAGSGNPRECDRCGRTHEVHATVKMPDGRTMCVGTGCMELGTAVARKAASNAATIARLRAQLRAAQATLAVAAAAETAVAGLTVPDVTSEKHPALGFDVLHCGDGGAIWCQFVKSAADLEERRETAVRSWRSKRFAELSATGLHAARQAVEDLEVRLARSEKRNASK